ncbi:DUF4390 domain-containing protein [Candidatus Eisenbacteria bacterium]|uniref:DUF4390 domain-containing protein n=1 Tax=Eiseniibacteriota bacterium TaxID=2212470 RepID=A0ABV6YIZ1_UNCEI
MRTKQRAYLRALLTGSCLVVGALVTDEVRATNGPELAVALPYRHETRLVVDLELTGVFDEETEAALEAGLPATVVFAWTLWRHRPLWWDSPVYASGTSFRIFYDVLDERYEVFNETGRRIEGCEDLTAVEETVGSLQQLDIGPISELDADRHYYLEVEAILVSLDSGEIQDLEDWLRGGLRQDADRDLFSDVSRHAVGVLRDMVGLKPRTAWTKSPHFHGWD